MKRDIVRFIGIAILILLFSFFVYPTPYKHLHYQNVMIKTNWITGNSWYWSLNEGWKEPKQQAP